MGEVQKHICSIG